MIAARDFMHLGAHCVGEDESLAAAALKMRDLHVGALPVCGPDDHVQAIVTDRDIVVGCVAAGLDPKLTTMADFAKKQAVWVDASTSAEEVVDVMARNQIRRVPVVEDTHLVGMISEADIATHLDEHLVGKFAAALASAPPSS